ncbi:MAG: ribosomal protein [Pseudomonadota bacterium]|jgi:large subunit ribosomal protein L20
MARVKRSVTARAYRKKVLKQAKGFYGRSKNCYSIAIQKVEKGGQYAYRDRKVKKRSFRSLWIVRLNAALREMNLKYSTFINMAKKADVVVNRKMLSHIASSEPKVFAELVSHVVAKNS